MTWDAADGHLDGEFNDLNYAKSRANLYEQGKPWPKPAPKKPVVKPPNNPPVVKPPNNPPVVKPPNNPPVVKPPNNPPVVKPPRNTKPAPKPTEPVATANQPDIENEAEKSGLVNSEFLSKNKLAIAGGLAALMLLSLGSRRQQPATYSAAPSFGYWPQQYLC